MINLTSVSKTYDMRLQRDDFSIKEGIVSLARRMNHNVRYKLGLKATPYVDPLLPLEGYGDGGPIRHVLRDINLTIREGETVALIGRNGCGKSTLLKIMAGIYQPNSGSVSVKGRISPLIELGAGFHPEFSGRENVYLNGQILGLSRQEIKKRFDDIVEFAEIKDYIGYPVRTYSSGMFMRLAFSVAINADPDVLLVDEIIAVGDAGFQAKCLAKMDEFKQQGKTIVIVTHSTQMVESWAHRAIYFKDGRAVCDDVPKKVVKRYLDDLNINSSVHNPLEKQYPLTSHRPLSTHGALKVLTLDQIDAMDIQSIAFAHDTGTLEMALDVTQLCSMAFSEALRVRVLSHDRGILLAEGPCNYSAQGLFKLEIAGMNALADNTYVLELMATDRDHQAVTIARIEFSLDRGITSTGLLRLPTRLSHAGAAV